MKTMSNKKTIKRTEKPGKKRVEEKKKWFGFEKSRIDPMKLVPAVVVILIWILYFFISM